MRYIVTLLQPKNDGCKNVFVIFSCSIILVLKMQTGPSNCWLRCRGGWYQCHCVSWRKRTYCLALEPKKPLLQPDWSRKLMDIMCNFWNVQCCLNYCTHILYRICIKCSVQSCIAAIYIWVLTKKNEMRESRRPNSVSIGIATTYTIRTEVG